MPTRSLCRSIGASAPLCIVPGRVPAFLALAVGLQANLVAQELPPPPTGIDSAEVDAAEDAAGDATLGETLLAFRLDDPAATKSPSPNVAAPPGPGRSSASSGSESSLENAPPATETSVPRGNGWQETDSLAESRRLAPPSAHRDLHREGSPVSERGSLLGRMQLQPGTRSSLMTAATGLGGVLALLLLTTWALKRRTINPGGVLPPEAFSLLGRSQLADRTVVELFRLGNKLVLTATTAEGLRPLTEVTDPTEVDRIAGLCAQARVHGPAAEFQQVLAQLAREPARGFLGGETRRR